jgi:signal transduction histidine kinase
MARTLRVLIVEDDPLDAELLERELRRGGYVVESQVVQTEDAMRRALAERAWDVVLSDYSMPQFDALGALRVAKGSGLDLPFIVASGTVGEETAVEAMRAGAHDFLLKGHLARLLPAIERELREAQLRRERREERARAEAERDRLLAELREAVSARDAFLLIASHELRTPLTAMKLAVQGLRRARARNGDATDGGPAASIVEMVDRQVVRLETLVASLLDVTRFTSGTPLAREDVDLMDVVRSALAQVRETHRQYPSETHVRGASVVGRWDRMRIESVVASLLSNALKFGNGAPVDVVVSHAPGRAVLEVIDRGIGIEPEALARIFDKFERAVPDRHYGGFGLGLWIARQAVEAHGGTVRVESAAGRGSRFVVELPTSAEAEEGKAVRTEATHG